MKLVLGATVLLSIAPFIASGQLAPPRVRDSAGVRIVEHATIRTDRPAFRLSPQPLAHVGGLRSNPDEEFDTRTGYEVAVRLSNGNIAVAENYGVRIVTAEGRFVRVLGRQGSGPGEFSSQVTGVCVLPGDGLLVLASSRRAVVYDSAGRHVRTTNLETYAASNDCGNDGSLIGSVLIPGTASPENSSVERRRVRLVRLDAAGAVRDTIGEYAAGIGRVPFTLFTDGLNLAAHRDRLYMGDGSTAEVSVRGLDGTLRGIIRWRDRLVPVTAELVERTANSRLPRTVTGAARSAQLAQMTSRPQRDSLPAYSDLRVDEAGRMWVRENTQGREWPEGYRPAWTVFNPDGSVLGRFEPPRIAGATRVAVVQVGTDYVVLRARGDNGVEVVVYGITPMSSER